MQISKRNNNIIISFKYDPYLVEVIRQIGDRKFDNRAKCWIVPMSQLETVLNRLPTLGFVADAEILEEFEKLKAIRDKLEKLRMGDFTETETRLLAETALPLFQFQKEGASFLHAAKNALNGDQPGLGKTIQAIAAIKMRKCKKILYFTYATLKATVEEEFKLRAPELSSIIIKGEKTQRDEKWSQDANVYIANYELLLRDLPEMQKIKWDVIIADEATKISNPKAKTTRAIKKLNATYRFPLSGTPLSNSVQDVWSIIDFCEPGALGSYWQFVDKYCEKDKWGSIKSYKNLDLLRKEIHPYCIRRLKKEVLQQLPPKLYENIYIDLSASERKMYNAIKQELKEELKTLGMTDRGGLQNMITKMLRLKQAVNSLELISDSKESSKLEGLKELLQTICTDGNKVVIFTSFKKMALILMRELAEYNPLLIAGGVSEQERNENKDKFNSNIENKLIISTDAGTHGLNLQKKSKFVVHYDIPWSVSKTEQREDRVHRIGQTGQVVVYKIIAKDTIDEYSLQVLNTKPNTAEQVLGDKDRLRKRKVSRAMLEKLLQ